MGNFNRDRDGDRRGGFNRGGDRRGGGFNRGDRPAMHKAVCDACHQDCEVPFKPSGDKPIFCSDCFSKQGGGNRNNDRRGNDRPRFENRSGGQSNQDSKDILKGIKTLNYKFDELLKALSPKAPADSKVKQSTEGTEKKSKEKKVATKNTKKTTTKKKVAKKKK